MSPDNRVTWENDKPRVDVRAKVTGAAKYTADVQLENMLHAGFLRFPLGAGELVEADVEAAKKVKGVVEVSVTVPKAAAYCGARMGYVVAETREAVEDALAALKPRFRAGLARTEPDREWKGPAAVSASEQASLDAMFGEAAAVVEATYRTQVQTHSALETHGGVVAAGKDSAEAWGSTQATFTYQDGLAGPLGMDASKIHVHNEFVGGGFGAKFGPDAEGTLAARMSKKHGRPCRVMLTRKEEHLDAGNRPGSIQYMKIAASKAGRILGGRIHIAGIVGHEKGGGEATNPALYDFGKVVETGEELTLTAGRPRAFRAPGWPQGVFAVESMMDELAAALAMDPVEFRLVNERSQRRRKQLEQGRTLIGWDRRKGDGTWPGRVKHGFGCGGAEWPLWPTQCGAEIDVFRNGKVEVRSGVQDIGTGTFTVVADTAAEVLGIPRETITARVGDSDFPQGPGSGGSMVTRSVVPAVMDAARQARDTIAGLAAVEWGIDSTKVAIADGIVSESGGTRTMTWEKACGLMTAQKSTHLGSIKQDLLGKGSSDGVQFVEVAVDTETGIVRVVKVVAIHCCGRPVNRLTCENQICGGVIQGISFALFEDRRLDRVTGGMVNPNLEAYKIVGSREVPEIIPVIDAGPEDTGARSLGEPVTIPTAGAIANAVANALGVRVRELPITPARVLRALAAKEGRA